MNLVRLTNKSELKVNTSYLAELRVSYGWFVVYNDEEDGLYYMDGISQEKFDFDDFESLFELPLTTACGRDNLLASK